MILITFLFDAEFLITLRKHDDFLISKYNIIENIVV